VQNLKIIQNVPFFVGFYIKTIIVIKTSSLDEIKNNNKNNFIINSGPFFKKDNQKASFFNRDTGIQFNPAAEKPATGKKLPKMSQVNQ
jgi:hypothetical protein